MRFVWFLNFWGWSRESHRAGLLLRHPLEGIGGNWHEWFNSEATAVERAEIATVGSSEDFQRQFWEWLGRVWIPEAVHNDNRLALVFVGEEFARVAPFDGWTAFARHRRPFPAGVLAAVVLGGESEGTAEDVRPVDAILLPMERPVAGRAIVADGFRAETSELNGARESALQLLRGRAGWRLLMHWVATGRRPYPAWLNAVLNGGWLVVGALIAWLWLGPDPGERLRAMGAVLLGLWGGLVLVAIAVTGVQVFSARRAGRGGAEHLARDQIRLRLPGRFTLKGGSAGLPFALGILHAVSRAYPGSLGQSWVWRQFSDGLEKTDAAWAATGMTTASGQVQPVELPAKLRACLRDGKISNLITPVQRESGRGAVERLTTEMAERLQGEQATLPDKSDSPRRPLRIHRCRHVADAVLAVARLPNAAQIGANLLALVLSGVMVWALPDLGCIVFPPSAPVVVAPSSPSPYFLWVSLDTRRPDFFQVVLDSPVWANRRADIAPRKSQPASVRAEIRLVRLSEASVRNLEEGEVWIERRPCFLTRRFEPGEIVGRYTMNYLNRLRHE